MILKNILPLFFVFLITGNLGAQDNELPNIVLTNLDGDNVDIQQLANEEEPIVFSFWATWCMPCIKELNAISDVIDDWRDETNVKFYAVSVDDSKTVSRVNPMVNGKGWDYEILLDTNNELKRQFNIATVPYVMVVKNGKIVFRHSGYQPGAENELYEKVVEYSN